MQQAQNSLHNRTMTPWLLVCITLLACNLFNSARADNAQISIIIDDMGDQYDAGMSALELPGAITYAFLPHTPHSKSQAILAHKSDKEVMLHLPMQAVNLNQLLGPGSLTLDMRRKQFGETFRADLASIPHAVGINNHMGSLLTRHPGHMQWLMEEIRQQQNLYFIDSRTTRHTIAYQVAHEHQIPSRQRDIFLDDDPNPTAITDQFEALIRHAKKYGSAIGIGHPYQNTIRTLKQLLPTIRQRDVELVPASQLVFQQSKTRIVKKTSEKLGPFVMKHPFLYNNP